MSPAPPPRPDSGAYGLVVEGLRGDPGALGLQAVPPDTGWPTVRLVWRRMTGRRPPAHAVDDDGATILLIGGGYAQVERASGTATIHTAEAIDEHDLVHPYLGLPAGVVASWHGRTSFHGGGVIVGARAWGVLGDREAGKTTLLAHLHRHGVGVLADDMVVVEGAVAFAGPRTLDLRPATAERWRGGDEIVVVRGGERTRLRLPAAPPVLPFAGWVLLEEGDVVEVTAVEPAERFEHLARQHMMGVNRPAAVLDLLTLPMWRLRRPRRWDALDATADRLLEALAHG